ncbi:MAG: PIG-L family deacetylase [Planctomycetes bacterium]|nr:PIG-L family deacetylase [Planctomycetota bacterium]
MSSPEAGIDILAIGAHPDDVEIAIGGTVIKMVRRGRKVLICDASNGEPTPLGDPETRLREAAAAAAVLGVEREVLDLRNRYIQDDLESRRRLAEVIRRHRPKVLLAPYPGSDHPDHHGVSRLCEAARFYAKLHKSNMYGQPWPGQPWWTPKLYYYFDLGVPYEQVRPSFIVDITAEWPEKLRTLACYRSQPGPTQQSWRGEEYYGKLIRTQYGEAFYSKEALGLDDLFHLL